MHLGLLAIALCATDFRCPPPFSPPKVFRTVAGALRASHPSAPAPSTLSEALRSLFEISVPAPDAAPGVLRLLQLLLAAREPPSVAALELLGVRRNLPHLPGWGVIFQVRGLRFLSVGACAAFVLRKAFAPACRATPWPTVIPVILPAFCSPSPGA